MRVNVNLFPKDGYFFTDSDGATLRGTTWKGVVSKVVNYRRLNKRPEGDPEKEVMAQACARNPSHCFEERNGTHKKQLSVTSLKSRVLVWITKLRGKLRDEPAQFVTEQEARKRADICASCPVNTGLPDGCASCRAVLSEMRTSVISRKRFVDNRLNACLVLGEDIGTAVHLDTQTTANDDLPAHCWRKRQ